MWVPRGGEERGGETRRAEERIGEVGIKGEWRERGGKGERGR